MMAGVPEPIGLILGQHQMCFGQNILISGPVRRLNLATTPNPRVCIDPADTEQAMREVFHDQLGRDNLPYQSLPIDPSRRIGWEDIQNGTGETARVW